MKVTDHEAVTDGWFICFQRSPRMTAEDGLGNDQRRISNIREEGKGVVARELRHPWKGCSCRMFTQHVAAEDK